jgi:hypothetical protein
MLGKDYWKVLVLLIRREFYVEFDQLLLLWFEIYSSPHSTNQKFCTISRKAKKQLFVFFIYIS